MIKRTSEKILHQDAKTKRKNRLPRTARVIFDGLDNAIHCQIRNMSENSAILTMGGWMGFPQEFSLYVEPDRIQAKCKIISRRGSTVEVSLDDIEHGVRLRGRPSTF